MSDTEIRMMRYTIEQLSTELRATKQYVSDIESKLERTRKALDVAVDALKEINDRYESEEQRGREEDDSPDWWDFAMDTGETLAKALDQIKELEQKELLENLELLVNNVFK